MTENVTIAKVCMSQNRRVRKDDRRGCNGVGIMSVFFFQAEDGIRDISV